MDYNYHTHTYRCSHATGTPEEYVLRALENGIRYMGFSDHIPFRCEDGYEDLGIRVPVKDAEAYVAQLRQLREKYRGQIDIAIGFETEYYGAHFPAMLENARRWGAEYLILGQHYVRPEHPDGVHSKHPTTDPVALEAYADSLVAGMKTGVFTFVAHPDVYNFVGDRDMYMEIMGRVCVASRELDVPLEINFYGIRDGRNYPCEAFWQVAGEKKAPVTFGFDAHTAESAFDGCSLPRAMELVEKYRLNYIGRPPIVRL